MHRSDDTKLATATLIQALSADGEHFLARHEDGRILNACTFEHAEAHHRNVLESGDYEMAEMAEDRGTSDGPPRVSTDAYRAGWDRVFGQGPPGEA